MKGFTADGLSPWLSAAWGERAGFAGAGSYIARVSIKGLIRDDEERVKELDKLVQLSRARAVIVHVDSPGGTTAGSEQLYDSLMRLKEKKPIVIVVDGLAASGGYITAIAGDHIVAKQTSIVGSIGVLFQYPNVGDLLGKIGVKVESIKSSPLKASPDGFEPTSPEARAAIESLIKDSFAWFKGLVQSRRHLRDEEGHEAGEREGSGRVESGGPALLLDEPLPARSLLTPPRDADQQTGQPASRTGRRSPAGTFGCFHPRWRHRHR